MDIPDDIQSGAHFPGNDLLDNAQDLVSQLPAEAQEATTTSTPLKETNTNNTAEIDKDTNPATDYTALSTLLIMDQPKPGA